MPDVQRRKNENEMQREGGSRVEVLGREDLHRGKGHIAP